METRSTGSGSALTLTLTSTSAEKCWSPRSWSGLAMPADLAHVAALAVVAGAGVKPPLADAAGPAVHGPAGSVHGRVCGLHGDARRGAARREVVQPGRTDIVSFATSSRSIHLKLQAHLWIAVDAPSLVVDDGQRPRDAPLLLEDHV